MRALQFTGNRGSVVVTIPDPSPGVGEVVVQMRAAGLCGSDLERYRGNACLNNGQSVVPGHEPCGEVVAIGPEVWSWKVGARVVVNHHHGCGSCIHCREGSPKYCLGEHGTYGI